MKCSSGEVVGFVTALGMNVLISERGLLRRLIRSCSCFDRESEHAKALDDCGLRMRIGLCECVRIGLSMRVSLRLRLWITLAGGHTPASSI